MAMYNPFTRRDHRACSGPRCRPGQDIEGCTGAPHWYQSPARRKDTVLAGEFAAFSMNRCDTGRDGKTPLQDCMGDGTTHRSWIWRKILYMPAKPARGGKWEPRFHPGVFVGMPNSSSEAVVVTEQGLAIKTRAANRRVRRVRRDGTLTAYSKCGPLLVPRWQ